MPEQGPEVHLFTDGGCSGNPGPGGWAYLMRHLPSGKEIENYGAKELTTNNQMELQAVIEGLTELKRPCHVELFTDSTYVASIPRMIALTNLPSQRIKNICRAAAICGWMQIACLPKSAIICDSRFAIAGLCCETSLSWNHWVSPQRETPNSVHDDP